MCCYAMFSFHHKAKIYKEDIRTKDRKKPCTNGKYEFEYYLDTAALIRSCEQYASLAAISRVSGVNERQLSHYATGKKKPRPQQRERIVRGLHEIGRLDIDVVEHHAKEAFAFTMTLKVLFILLATVLAIGTLEI